LRNFSSKSQNFPPGILELQLQNSSEIQKIKAYPKQIFTECAKVGEYQKPMYVIAQGERSICVYSFDTD